MDPEEPIHQVINAASFGGRAVTLHIYSKPFDTCEVYDLRRNPTKMSARQHHGVRRSQKRCAHGEGDSLKIALLVLMAVLPLAARDPLAARIAHSDPAKYQPSKGVHGGAGELLFAGMFDATSLNTNLLFLHRGVIQPKGGIGHHYHNQMEEMFVILDNEAEFTIDGRTARVEGPAGAPCPWAVHMAFVPTDRPTEWMNIAVGSVKEKYDTSIWATTMGALDAKPVLSHAPGPGCSRGC